MFYRNLIFVLFFLIFLSCSDDLYVEPALKIPIINIEINNYEEIISKGVSKIACMAVNDPHVMQAWGEVSNANDKIDMLSDSDCSVSKSLGLDHNFGKVLGHRSKRFAIIVDNNVIQKIFVEEIGAFDVSTAENILNNL